MTWSAKPAISGFAAAMAFFAAGSDSDALNQHRGQRLALTRHRDHLADQSVHPVFSFRRCPDRMAGRDGRHSVHEVPAPDSHNNKVTQAATCDEWGMLNS